MLHLRRPTLLALTMLAALAGPVAAPAADPTTSTRSVAVQVVVPGAKTTQAGASGSGSYSYRDLVSVGAYEVASTQSRSKAQAAARTSSVSLLGGLVTAASATGAVRADGSGKAASGEIGGGVEGLVINGQAVAPGTSARFDVPGIGYVVTDERVVVSDPSSPAYRGFQVGLHLHLTEGWHDMPAGTEVLIGFADAGAQVAPEPRGGAAVPEPEPVETPPVVPAPPTFTPPPGYAPGDVAGYEDEGELPDTQDPPPGGFTVDPPIDAALRERLLGAGYLFPVAGGASFTNDFGAPRASTGFHQGIDLFGPLGTPLLAVTDGTLVNVGWNGLGGHRLWLQGDDGTYFYYAHLSAYAPIARERRARARGRSGRVPRQLGRGAHDALAPAFRDPSERQVGRGAIRVPDALDGKHGSVRRRHRRAPPAGGLHLAGRSGDRLDRPLVGLRPREHLARRRDPAAAAPGAR